MVRNKMNFIQADYSNSRSLIWNYYKNKIFIATITEGVGLTP